MLLSAGWALLIVLILLVLAGFAGLILDGPAVFCALILLGPIVSAVFCDRLNGVLLGAVGLGAGLLIADLIAAVFFTALVDWVRVLILIPPLMFGHVVVGVFLWWSIGKEGHQKTRRRNA
jgi:hypothetical protein